MNNWIGADMPEWDAGVYLRFADERIRPSLDLAARINISHPRRIIDLGCGPGNSTEILRRRWPEAEVIGLDSSPEMIAAASKSSPNEKWVLADIATWKADRPFDLVFSNAALHWVPDHARVLPHLFWQVEPGGALAIQIPAHHSSLAHQLILEVADDPLWSNLMDGPRNAMTKESPAFYYNVLGPLASNLEVWETIYYHVMDGAQAIVNWFRGTGLRPFLSVLGSQVQRQAFEEKLLKRFARDYPEQKDGRVLFPFRRLFVVAYQGA